MDCEEFEKRVQWLLDNRENPVLDDQISLHADECESCRDELDVYQCFASLGIPETDFCPVQVADADPVANDGPLPSSLAEFKTGSRTTPVQAKSGRSAWRDDQARNTRHRFGMAIAALLFVSAILVSRPSGELPVAMSHFDDSQSGSLPDGSSQGWLGLNRLVDFTWEYGSSLTGGLAESTDLSAIGRIDLMTLMPQEPVNAMLQIPATIESMEPIYRYSTDLPLLNHWSTGIGYTIDLIQSSFAPPSTPDTENDLGSLSDGAGRILA